MIKNFVALHVENPLVDRLLRLSNFFYNKAIFRLCNFDCRYYCEECCHRGDESIIPARVIWNWDYKPRSISQSSKAYLKSIADRPLFRIDKINSKLYEHSYKMHNVFVSFTFFSKIFV